jgi:hypothetical protein
MAARPKYKFAAIDAKALVAGMRIISPTYGESPLIKSVVTKGRYVHVRLEGLKYLRKYRVKAGLMVRNVGV